MRDVRGEGLEPALGDLVYADFQWKVSGHQDVAPPWDL